MLTLGVTQARMLVPAVLGLTAFKNAEIWVHLDRLREYKEEPQPHPSVSALIIEPSTVSSTSQSFHFSFLQLLDAYFRYSPTTLFESFDLHHQLSTQLPST